MRHLWSIQAEKDVQNYPKMQGQRDLRVTCVQVGETGQEEHMASIFWSRVQQIFSIKGQIANILDFVDHMVSTITFQLGCCSVKAATENV